MRLLSYFGCVDLSQVNQKLAVMMLPVFEQPLYTEETLHQVPPT